MKKQLSTLMLLFSVLSVSGFARDMSEGHAKAYDDYPFYFRNKISKNQVNNTKDNQLQILHSGIASLQKRIDLIRKAKKRISIEYFIWEEDTAGLLMWHELIKRAKEGIDIRIILDKSITVIRMDDFYAQAVKKYNIDLRYYHRALDPSSAQFRTHRKILVIDGQEAITGGRNIGDDYFDMDEEYGFVDRDVYVQGKVAKAIEDSFDAFWKDDVVVKARVLDTNPSSNRLFRNRSDRSRYQGHRQEALDRRRKEAKEWIEGHEEMESVSQQVEEIARPILNSYPTEVCPDLTFATDRPGANFIERVQRGYRNDYKVLRKVLFDHIENETKASDEFILASPYFMLNEQWQKSLSLVIGKKGVKTSIYTNSLGSTDAFYVAAVFYDKILDWQKVGLSPFIHDSKFNPYYPVLNEKVESSRWGMHDKTQLYNNESFFIGTYNIDNRSDFYNAEMGIFCAGSRTLAQNLKADMKERISKSYLITGEGKAMDQNGNEADFYGNATQKQIKVMKRFTIPSLLFEPLL